MTSSALFNKLNELFSRRRFLEHSEIVEFCMHNTVSLCIRRAERVFEQLISLGPSCIYLRSGVGPYSSDDVALSVRDSRGAFVEFDFCGSFTADSKQTVEADVDAEAFGDFFKGIAKTASNVLGGAPSKPKVKKPSLSRSTSKVPSNAVPVVSPQQNRVVLADKNMIRAGANSTLIVAANATITRYGTKIVVDTNGEVYLQLVPSNVVGQPLALGRNKKVTLECEVQRWPVVVDTGLPQSIYPAALVGKFAPRMICSIPGVQYPAQDCGDHLVAPFRHVRIGRADLSSEVELSTRDKIYDSCSSIACTTKAPNAHIHPPQTVNSSFTVSDCRVEDGQVALCVPGLKRDLVPVDLEICWPDGSRTFQTRRSDLPRISDDVAYSVSQFEQQLAALSGSKWSKSQKRLIPKTALTSSHKRRDNRSFGSQLVQEIELDTSSQPFVPSQAVVPILELFAPCDFRPSVEADMEMDEDVEAEAAVQRFVTGVGSNMALPEIVKILHDANDDRKEVAVHLMGILAPQQVQEIHPIPSPASSAFATKSMITVDTSAISGNNTSNMAVVAFPSLLNQLAVLSGPVGTNYMLGALSLDAGGLQVTPDFQTTAVPNYQAASSYTTTVSIGTPAVFTCPINSCFDQTGTGFKALASLRNSAGSKVAAFTGARQAGGNAIGISAQSGDLVKLAVQWNTAAPTSSHVWTANVRYIDAAGAQGVISAAAAAVVGSGVASVRITLPATTIAIYAVDWSVAVTVAASQLVVSNLTTILANTNTAYNKGCPFGDFTCQNATILQSLLASVSQTSTAFGVQALSMLWTDLTSSLTVAGMLATMVLPAGDVGEMCGMDASTLQQIGGCNSNHLREGGYGIANCVQDRIASRWSALAKPHDFGTDCIVMVYEGPQPPAGSNSCAARIICTMVPVIKTTSQTYNPKNIALDAGILSALSQVFAYGPAVSGNKNHNDANLNRMVSILQSLLSKKQRNSARKQVQQKQTANPRQPPLNRTRGKSMRTARGLNIAAPPFIPQNYYGQ